MLSFSAGDCSKCEPARALDRRYFACHACRSNMDTYFSRIYMHVCQVPKPTPGAISMPPPAVPVHSTAIYVVARIRSRSRSGYGPSSRCGLPWWTPARWRHSCQWTSTSLRGDCLKIADKLPRCRLGWYDGVMVNMYTYLQCDQSRSVYMSKNKEFKRKPIQPHELDEIPETLEDMVLACQPIPADRDVVEAQRKVSRVQS